MKSTRILHPYNEILPKRKAHDVFIFQQCAELARAHCSVTLLCGRGSLENSLLHEHYATPKLPSFEIKQLPIIRKNNFLNVSWNFPFFFFCQKEINKQRPDWVILSVRKQGAYHLARKIPGVRYLYEVHELCYYPTVPTHPLKIQSERALLQKADLITVTTNALKDILIKPPYSLQVPIEVVPLAVAQTPLLPPSTKPTITLMYIGQLYAGQGVELLLQALAQVDGIHTTIVGGKKEEIDRLRALAKQWGVDEKVKFLGFVPPHALREIAQEADVFVAPFKNKGRMPYVAHTKLLEYAQWNRPIIAPKLPVVEEHFQKGAGALLYEADNVSSLAACLSSIKEEGLRKRLQEEMHRYRGKFSWETRIAAYKRALELITPAHRVIS